MAVLRGQIETLTWGGYDDGEEFVEDGHHRVTVRTDDDVRIGMEPAVVFTGDSLAQHDAEVRAKALEDAAEAVSDSIATEPRLMHVVDWVEGIEHAERLLRDRAASERGEG